MENERIEQLEKSNEKLCSIIEELKQSIFRYSDIYNISTLHEKVLTNQIEKLHDWRIEEFQEIMDE